MKLVDKQGLIAALMGVTFAIGALYGAMMDNRKEIERRQCDCAKHDKKHDKK